MKMCLSAALCVSLAGALPLLAQEHVIPLGFENSAGGSSFLGPLANASRTYQMQLHQDQLTLLVGSDLTGIAFRNTPTITTSWPAALVTYPSYEIHIAPGVDPANRVLDFAANYAGSPVQVRAGVLTIQPDSYTIGSSPNAFGPTIEFDQPYTYTGGHLIIEIRHTGSDSGNSRSVDGIGTANPGYLNQFAACWQGTGGVLQGNFTIAQISYEPAGGGCYANCDGSTTEPILNVDDFTCFINEFANAQNLPHEQQVTHYANCDQSSTAPVLNVDDFTCFINAFAQGCP